MRDLDGDGVSPMSTWKEPVGTDRQALVVLVVGAIPSAIGRSLLRLVLNSMASQPFVLAATLAFAGFAPAQGALIVDAAHAGHYSQIQSAVDAAAPGSVILVRPGDYAAFEVRAKGLRIIGEPGAQIRSRADGFCFTVRDVPPGADAVIAGLVTIPGAASAGFVSNCQGHVHIENVAVRLLVHDARQISLHRVIPDSRSGNPVPGLSVSNSTLVATQCSFVGYRWSDGVLVLTSNVSLAHCVCQGGDSPQFPYPVGVGVRVTGGTVRITGPGSLLIAGAGASFGPALLASSGQAIVDPVVTLRPSGSQPPFLGNVLVRPVPAAQASGGSMLTTQLYARSAQYAVTFLSLPAPRAITPFGELWLCVPEILVDAGPVPPSFTRQASVPLPVLPPGIVGVVQGAAFGTSGIELSTPSVLIVQ